MKSNKVKIDKEVILKGFPASGGISFGKAFILNRKNRILEVDIASELINNEKIKYESLRNELAQEFKEIHQSLLETNQNLAEIYESHSMVLQDDFINGEIISKIQNGKSSGYSIKSSFDKQINILKSADNALMKERANDFEDLKNLFLERLNDEEDIVIPEGAIVFAKHLSTKDIYNFIKAGIKGFVTEVGGLTSHASIIARAFDTPYIFGAKNLTKYCSNDEIVILDAERGTVIIKPTSKTISDYDSIISELEKHKAEINSFINLNSITKDGKKIRLKSNLDHPEELYDIKQIKTDGIGLVRTENLVEGKYIFNEERQSELYTQIAEENFPNPVTIRLFDYGGDKPPKGFIFKEENPALGLRGIRFLLENPKILITQLRSILKASIKGNIEILVPMITDPKEIISLRTIINQVKISLQNDKISYNENIKLGIMVEIPAVFYFIQEISKIVDFYSIGTNDLMQYFFAADRVNDSVTEFHNQDNPIFFKFLFDLFKKLKKTGKPFSICGELAQNKQSLEKLIGIGFDEFSVSSSKLLELKNHISSINQKSERRAINKFFKRTNFIQ